MKKIHPTNGNVLLRRVKETHDPNRPIQLVYEEGNRDVWVCEVVAIGEPKTGKDASPPPSGLEVGSKVLVRSYGGSRVDIEGEAHFLIDWGYLEALVIE